MRGPGGFHGGRVSDALVSQIDLFPTICELAGIERPDWIRGNSMLPLLRKETKQINDAVFAEITFHAAYEPQRAVRTERYKYIRRFENGHEGPVLANIDDSPSKDLLLAHGLADRVQPQEELFDLVFDPNEAANLVADPAHADVLAELSERGSSAGWRRPTTRCCAARSSPLPGTEINHPAQRSPSDPTYVVQRQLMPRAVVLQTQHDAPAGLLADWAASRGIDARRRAGRPRRAAAGSARRTTSRSRSARAPRPPAPVRNGWSARSSGCARPTPPACPCSASASARRCWPPRSAVACTGSSARSSAG